MTTATATTSPTIAAAAAVNLGELTVASTTSSWTDDQWADYINAPEANPVLAIIERGKRIGEKHRDCNQKGDRTNTFEAFCKKFLNMSVQYAKRFVEIGKSGETLKPQFQSLPASVNRLYELTRLTETEFNNAIQSGAIHPEMTRAEAEALRSNRPALPAASNQAPQARDNTPSPVMPTPALVESEEGEDDPSPSDLGPAVFTDTSTASDDEENTTTKGVLNRKSTDEEELLAQAAGLINIQYKPTVDTFEEDFRKIVSPDYFLTCAKGKLIDALSAGSGTEDSVTAAKRLIREEETRIREMMEHILIEIGNKAMSSFMKQTSENKLLNDPTCGKLLQRAFDTRSSSTEERRTAIHALKKKV